jgi:large subunit ribosomal protein L25
MANKHSLSVQPRTVIGRKVKQLRHAGLVPANVFGKNAESANIQMPVKDFSNAYAEVGESTLLYLSVDGEKEARPVLVREVTRHPVTSEILHIDFNQVSLKEKVTAPVKIELTGEAPAEKEKLGILVQQLDEVELEALPTEMPEHLEVSVEKLIAVDDAILVKDLPLDYSRITIKSDPEAIIVKIEPLPAEEPVEEVPVEGEAAESAATGEAEGETSEEKPAAEEKTE